MDARLADFEVDCELVCFTVVSSGGRVGGCLGAAGHVYSVVVAIGAGGI